MPAVHGGQQPLRLGGQGLPGAGLEPLQVEPWPWRLPIRLWSLAGQGLNHEGGEPAVQRGQAPGWEGAPGQVGWCQGDGALGSYPGLLFG